MTSKQNRLRSQISKIHNISNALNTYRTMKFLCWFTAHWSTSNPCV